MSKATYRSKQERRAREATLRVLGREYRKAVNSMASQYVYSGSCYEHVAADLDRINARIREVYLEDGEQCDY